MNAAFALRTLAGWYEREWKRSGGEKESDAEEVRLVLARVREVADELSKESAL